MHSKEVWNNATCVMLEEAIFIQRSNYYYRRVINNVA